MANGSASKVNSGVNRKIGKLHLKVMNRFRITLNTYLEDACQYHQVAWAIRYIQSRRGGDLWVPSGPLAVTVRLSLGYVEGFVLQMTQVQFRIEATDRRHTPCTVP